MSQIDQKDPARVGRNAVVAGSVVVLHIAGLWAVQAGMANHTTPPEVIIPAQLMSEFISPPAPAPAPRPTPPAPDTQASTAQTGTGAASKAEARAAQADPGTHAACDQRSGTRAQCARWCTGADAARATCTARSSTCTPKPGARAASTSGCATHRAALQQCCLPEQPQACLPVGQPAPG